jgi:hypothetical protein
MQNFWIETLKVIALIAGCIVVHYVIFGLQDVIILNHFLKSGEHVLLAYCLTVHAHVVDYYVVVVIFEISYWLAFRIFRNFDLFTIFQDLPKIRFAICVKNLSSFFVLRKLYSLNWFKGIDRQSYLFLFHLFYYWSIYIYYIYFIYLLF